MTKKHYIEIAAEFNAGLEIARCNAGDKKECKAAENAVLRMIDGFCVIARRDNPNFDKTRFLKACGV